MAVVYAIRNTAVSDNNAVIADQLKELAERKFACHILLRTLREAYELTDWYLGGAYKSRYAYCLGFNKRAPKETAFKRVSKEQRRWVLSEDFEKICLRLELNPDQIRCAVHQILLCNPEQRARIAQYLDQIERELEIGNGKQETSEERAG